MKKMIASRPSMTRSVPSSKARFTTRSEIATIGITRLSIKMTYAMPNHRPRHDPQAGQVIDHSQGGEGIHAGVIGPPAYQGQRYVVEK